MQPTAASTYVIPEPFEEALRCVREAIEHDGLSISSELDISGRLKREFGIALTPCRILLVDCPVALLKGLALDSSVAMWLPLHVVVSGRREKTSVGVLRLSPDAADGQIRGVRDRLNRALQRIAMRENPGTGVTVQRP